MTRPSLVVCFAAVTVSRLLLRYGGFKRAVAVTNWVAKRFRSGGRRAVRGDAGAMARGIAVAAAFFPGRAICLEQSLALYVLLTRWGHSASLRIGVQPVPFKAHAWVEVEGRPVYENEDDLSKFVPFPGVFA